MSIDCYLVVSAFKQNEPHAETFFSKDEALEYALRLWTLGEKVTVYPVRLPGWVEASPQPKYDA